MHGKSKGMVGVLIAISLMGECALCGEPRQMDKITAAMEKLRPLHKKLGKPRPGDWLSRFRERGQTFKEFVASQRHPLRGKRRIIYIQPLGNFTPTQRKIINLTAEFVGIYFNLPVKIEKDLPLSLVPPSARRRHPAWGMEQILTTYVLEKILLPRLPEDAAAYLGLTTSDLWPGEGWNFVFGQALLAQPVGVWSIYRNGDPDESDAAFRLCLLRTMKTAAHEIGHMFGMMHCIAYQCNMCGSNSREESDRRPIALCPECVAKVWWFTGADPVRRYEKLAEFCRKNGLVAEAQFYEKSIAALKGD